MQIEPLKISRLKYEIDSAKDEKLDSEIAAKGYDTPRESFRRQYAVHRMSLKTEHAKLLELYYSAHCMSHELMRNEEHKITMNSSSGTKF
jgi:hypothetical protein